MLFVGSMLVIMLFDLLMTVPYHLYNELTFQYLFVHSSFYDGDKFLFVMESFSMECSHEIAL